MQLTNQELHKYDERKKKQHTDGSLHILKYAPKIKPQLNETKNKNENKN